jgi:hypothetical protein
LRTPSSRTAINSFTQFDAVLSANQILTGRFHFAPHSQQYAGLDYFNPQPVTSNADFHETTGTLTDRLAIGGGLLQSTIASRAASLREIRCPLQGRVSTSEFFRSLLDDRTATIANTNFHLPA